VNGSYKERPDVCDNTRIIHEFIEAEREHNCGKIQVSLALPDIMEGAGALAGIDAIRPDFDSNWIHG
jgi:hypothetical protein